MKNNKLINEEVNRVKNLMGIPKKNITESTENGLNITDIDIDIEDGRDEFVLPVTITGDVKGVDFGFESRSLLNYPHTFSDVTDLVDEIIWVGDVSYMDEHGNPTDKEVSEEDDDKIKEALGSLILQKYNKELTGLMQNINQLGGNTKKNQREGLNEGGTEPQILFPDWLSTKLKDVHTKIGQGSIFAVDIDKVIEIAKKVVNSEKNIEKIANSSGTISTNINGIGYDLVLPIDKVKGLPNIQRGKTKKVEGQNTVEVPAIKTSAPLSTFKTNLLTIIVRPMKNDSDEVIPNSYIILSVFPGNPNVPRVSEWDNKWAVILPKK